MRNICCIGIGIVVLMHASAALAGPPLACHEFASSPGSVFGQLEKLRRGAMVADDSPSRREAALLQLKQLKAAIKPGDAVSLLLAGYWAELLHSIRVYDGVDGGTMILKALEMRPDDAEYEFIAALAYFGTDPTAFRSHWRRAQSLARTGSATALNLKRFGEILLGTRQ